jgi:hypothetical protein
VAVNEEAVTSVFASLDIFGISWFLPRNIISKLHVCVRPSADISIIDTNWPVFVKIHVYVMLLHVHSLVTFQLTVISNSHQHANV